MKKTLQAPDPIDLIKKQQDELRDVESALGIDQLGWESSTTTSTEITWKPKYVSKYKPLPKKIPKDPIQEKYKYWGDIVEDGELDPIVSELYKMYDIEPYPTYKIGPSVELDEEKPPVKKQYSAPPKEDKVEVPAGESGKFGRVVDLD